MQKKRWLVLAGVVAALFSLALVLTACNGDEDEAEPTATTATEPADQTPAGGVTVDVYHAEWELTPSVDTVPAGTVIFNAANDGTIPHNFRLARTDLAPEALRVDQETFTVDEEQLEIVARSEDLDVGEVEQVVVDLEPGSYVMFCNIATHYEVGLYAGFTVE